MPTTITVQWDDPVSQLGIDENLVHQGILHGVRESLLTDPDFRERIVAVIAAYANKVSDEAIAESLKHELIHFLKSKVQPLKDELNAVVKDFDYMERSHASEYAARRKQELIAKLHDLNSL